MDQNKAFYPLDNFSLVSVAALSSIWCFLMLLVGNRKGIQLVKRTCFSFSNGYIWGSSSSSSIEDG